MFISDYSVTAVHQVLSQFGEKIAVLSVFVMDMVLNWFLYFGLNASPYVS